MIGYQNQYAPQRAWLAQAVPTPPASAPVVAPTTVVAPAPAPEEAQGTKVVKTLLTLGVTGAAALVGVRAAMKEKGLPKVAGFVAAGGAGLLLLATLINVVSPDTAKPLMIPFKFAS